MPRFIDLSVSIDNNEHSDHPGGSPKVTSIANIKDGQWSRSLFSGFTALRFT